MITTGLSLNVGPAAWDPSLLLVRGEPATYQPGMESAFPKILGSIHGALSLCLLDTATIGFTSLAAQTSTFPVMVYHFGGFIFMSSVIPIL
jgi:hypothetical protein